MTLTSHSDLSSANPGEALPRFAARHSRPGRNLPALFSRPRSTERALGTTSLALQLAFDSLRGPVPVGHRGGASGDRHLVYLSSEYAVDVHLVPNEHQPGVLRGELLSRNDGPIAEVPTFLLEGDEIAGYDRTGSLGEFQLETAGAVDLRLCLLLDAERCIELPIETEPLSAAANDR